MVNHVLELGCFYHQNDVQKSWKTPGVHHSEMWLEGSNIDPILRDSWRWVIAGLLEVVNRPLPGQNATGYEEIPWFNFRWWIFCWSVVLKPCDAMFHIIVKNTFQTDGSRDFDIAHVVIWLNWINTFSVKNRTLVKEDGSMSTEHAAFNGSHGLCQQRF